MMLSICIPVYNFDVNHLVIELKKQIIQNNINAEIILIDDASDKTYLSINQNLKNIVDDFIFLEKNVGRSLVRNLFLYYSKGDYLLFLDCDGKIISEDYLRIYTSYIYDNQNSNVIYGGRNVSSLPPEKEKYLRWKFAVERENLDLEKRILSPYLSFQTNNFIIRKDVLKKINFNPEFQKYGYEDLLFAMDLKKENIEILHIHNPILNDDIETNSVYLNKVEESIDSLSKMLKNKKIKSNISDIKLVKAYAFMNDYVGKLWFQKLFQNRKDKTKQKLLQGNINLRYLDFYKLGILMEKMNDNN